MVQVIFWDILGLQFKNFWNHNCWLISAGVGLFPEEAFSSISTVPAAEQKLIHCAARTTKSAVSFHVRGQLLRLQILS